MTSSRFFLARVALAFGISRRNQRMSDAAFETHLLREGEQILGAEAWEAAENIEELSAEYWNLRKLRHEREQLEPSLAEAEATLAEAHEERARLLNQATETQQKLEEERAALMKELEDAARKRDEIVAEAKGIRRIYEGLKMKLQVLAEESTGPETQQEIAKTRERIGELRQDFEELKKQVRPLVKKAEIVYKQNLRIGKYYNIPPKWMKETKQRLEELKALLKEPK